MKNILKSLFVLVVINTFFMSCNAQTTDPESLKELATDSTTVIIDVRSVGEFEDGHIKNSINIPLNDIADTDQLKEMKEYKNIILVCRSGRRSAKAMSILQKQGFTNVYNGGGWEYLQKLLSPSKE